MTATSSASAYSGLQQLKKLTAVLLWSDKTSRLSINSEMAFLTQLPGLQELALPKGASFDVNLLASLKQLKVLDVEKLTFLPSTHALLAHLPQHLSRLCLTLDCGAALQGTPAAYSALTAGSCLQHLRVGWRCVPQAVWFAMFPADRQLTALTCLSFNEAEGDWSQYIFPPDLDGVVLSRLGACCPRLQSLTLWWGTERGSFRPDLKGLRALTTVTQLCITNVSDAGAAVIAHLTGLRELEVLPNNGLVRSLGFTAFSALQQLTKLFVMERWEMGQGGRLNLENEVGRHALHVLVAR